MFVTLKVFKLIGPSNDGRRHGRGTYLFVPKVIHLVQTFLALNDIVGVVGVAAGAAAFVVAVVAAKPVIRTVNYSNIRIMKLTVTVRIIFRII
jgi:hypothetical protein